LTHGFVKLHRKILNSPVFQNANLYKVFSWCLLKASYKPYEALVGLRTIKLLPGQFIYGRKVAAQELDMPESSVRNYIDSLRKRKILDIKTDNKFSLITIVNWDLYQSEELEQDSKQDNNKTTTGHIQEVKELKEKNICMNSSHDNNFASAEKPIGGAKCDTGKGKYTEEFELFWFEYPRKIGKGDAFRAWNSRLKDKIIAGNLILAAKNYSKHCKEKNTDIEYIKHPKTFLSKSEPYRDYVKTDEPRKIQECFKPKIIVKEAQR
jgi:hypothetical protein